MAYGGSISTWMAFKTPGAALPTYDVIARNYAHYRIPRPAVPEQGGSPPGQICWGTVGEMPTAEPVPTVSFEVKEQWQETSRKSHLVRVENPDDPSQYVMEDRPEEIKFTKTITDSRGNTSTSSGTVDFSSFSDAEMSGLVSRLEAKHYEAIMRYQTEGIQGR